MTAAALPIAERSEAERREQWLADRRTCITATDAAKVLGCSPFGGSIDVYAEKLGLVEDRGPNKHMLRGKRREQIVLADYAEAEECELTYADPFTLLRAPRGLPIGATLDAVRIDDGRPVEAKTCRWPGVEWGPEGTDIVPTHYAVQVAIQLLVTDKPFGDLPVEFGGEEYACYRIHRNHQTEQDLIDVLCAFHANHVEKQVPPPIDGSESYTAFLKRAYPSHVDVELIATGEQADRARDYFERVKPAFDAAEAEVNRIKNLFRDEMGTTKRLVGEGWRCRWAQNRDSIKTNWEAVARDLGTKVGLVAGIFADPARLTLYRDGVETALAADLRDAFATAIKDHTHTSPGDRPFFLELTK